jgi:hypothetical protein
MLRIGQLSNDIPYGKVPRYSSIDQLNPIQLTTYNGASKAINARIAEYKYLPKGQKQADELVFCLGKDTFIVTGDMF